MRYQTDTEAFVRLSKNLTPIQRAILREIRDRYLQTGGPLTDDDLKDLGGMQHADVRAVLNTAFERQGSVWKCEQIQSEVEALNAKKQQAKEAAKLRWESAKKPARMRSHRGSDAVAMRTHSGRNAVAMRTHQIKHQSGFAVDSATLGGTIGGECLISKEVRVIEPSINTPPYTSPNEIAKEPDWLITVAKWFGRDSVPFGTRERFVAEMLEKPTEGDIATLSRYYNAPHPEGRDYRRRSLAALLENWSTEMDRARMHVKAAKAREAAL